MCRLFGLKANKPVDICFSMLGEVTCIDVKKDRVDTPSAPPNTFQNMASQNPHGWGIGWYKTGRPEISKEPLSADASDKFLRTTHSAQSETFICHVRYATKGDSVLENTHPFKYSNWLFAHNGTVDREDIYGLLDEDMLVGIKGCTDSEVYFLYLLQCINTALSTGKDVIDGIRDCVHRVKETAGSGMNFILSDGESMYGFRYSNTYQDYYSLYYLVRDPIEGPSKPFSARSAELATLLESKALNKEKALLLCSEPLTDEDWAELPVGSLLSVSKDLKPSEIKCFKG